MRITLAKLCNTENVTGNIAVNVFDQGLPYGR